MMGGDLGTKPNHPGLFERGLEDVDVGVHQPCDQQRRGVHLLPQLRVQGPHSGARKGKI